MKVVDLGMVFFFFAQSSVSAMCFCFFVDEGGRSEAL